MLEIINLLQPPQLLQFNIHTPLPTILLTRTQVSKKVFFSSSTSTNLIFFVRNLCSLVGPPTPPHLQPQLYTAWAVAAALSGQTPQQAQPLWPALGANNFFLNQSNQIKDDNEDGSKEKGKLIALIIFFLQKLI